MIIRNLKSKFDYSLLKGLTAVFLFHSFYAFVFALVFGAKNQLAFVLNAGFVHLFVFINAIFTAIPYVLGGYLIVLARNSYTDLAKKNKKLNIVLFFILLVVFMLVGSFQLLFEHREIYKVFIFLNYPTTRYIYFLNSDSIMIYVSMFLSVILVPLAFYIGGKLRISELKRGGYYE